MILQDLLLEVRKRISQVESQPIRYALMDAYLKAARASEVVAFASRSDTTTPYGPKGTDASEALFYPPSGGDPEPAVVFTVRTAKKDGAVRYVALPLNPKYEPWSKELFEYYKKRKDKYVFPFTRQTLYNHAKKAFAGLKYEIAPQRFKDEEIGEHEKEAGVHFLRHLRASELVGVYGFTPMELASYCGWSYRAAGLTPVMMRYVSYSWQSYFPKLLRPSIYVLKVGSVCAHE
jgi:hypothetical protein